MAHRIPAVAPRSSQAPAAFGGLILLTLAACLAIPASAKPPVVESHNCGEMHPDFLESYRASPGKYVLSSVYCTNAYGSFDADGSDLSPDGSALAWMADNYSAAATDGSSNVLAISSLETFRTLKIKKTLSRQANELPSWLRALVWSADSRHVWAASRLTTVPAGWSTTGITLMRVERDGSTTPLPQLRSPSGPLDALEWVDRSGKALAQFGTRGSFYRPEHSDTNPMLAMIDGATGKILDQLPLYSLKLLQNRMPETPAYIHIDFMQGVVANNRVHAIIGIGSRLDKSWVFWTQGQPAREVAVPTSEEWFTKAALLPSGKRYLIARHLAPSGVRISCEPGPCKEPPPPLKPKTGALLELRDVKTGATIWTVSQTVDEDWSGQLLEVSSDGHYALASWPERTERSAQIALIRLSDGAVEQFFPLDPDRGRAGFLDDGKSIWTFHGSVAFYRITG